jgi:hypothetical protein
MMRSLLSMLVLGCLVATAGAQDTTKTVSGPAPSIIVVSSVDSAGTLLSKQIQVVTVPVQVPKEVIVGGMKQIVFQTEYRYETREVMVKHLLRGAEYYNAKGEKVKQEDALKRLTPGTIVLVSADGRKVDPAYLRIIKDDTLILVQAR